MIARLHTLRAAGAVHAWSVEWRTPLVMIRATTPTGDVFTVEGGSYESAVRALVTALEGTTR